MQAHIVTALMHGCRGFVREAPAQRRHLREAPSSGGEGRPLGATVDVMGIDRTISASAEFGDFYRHASQACIQHAACAPDRHSTGSHAMNAQPTQMSLTFRLLGGCPHKLAMPSGD